MMQRPSLSLHPVLYVHDFEGALAFFRALGAAVTIETPDGDFALLAIRTESMLEIMSAPDGGDNREARLELKFEAGEPIVEVEEKLRAAGVDVVGYASDKLSNRQLLVRGPDELVVKIDEIDEDLR